MGLAGSLLGLVTPIATGWIFDWIIPGAERSQLLLVILALTVSALAGAVFQITNSIAQLRLQTRMDGDAQAAVWDRLLDLPAPYFRRFTAGDLADRSMAISMIRQVLTDVAMSGVLNLVFSLAYFGLLFYYDVRLALLGLRRLRGPRHHHQSGRRRPDPLSAPLFRGAQGDRRLCLSIDQRAVAASASPAPSEGPGCLDQEIHGAAPARLSHALVVEQHCDTQFGGAARGHDRPLRGIFPVVPDRSVAWFVSGLQRRFCPGPHGRGDGQFDGRLRRRADSASGAGQD